MKTVMLLLAFLALSNAAVCFYQNRIIKQQSALIKVMMTNSSCLEAK